MVEEGILIQVGELERIGQKATPKRTFIIDRGNEDFLAFEIWQDKAEKLPDHFEEGQTVRVSYKIGSRAWKDRWFTSATATDISAQ